MRYTTPSSRLNNQFSNRVGAGSKPSECQRLLVRLMIRSVSVWREFNFRRCTLEFADLSLCWRLLKWLSISVMLLSVSLNWISTQARSMCMSFALSVPSVFRMRLFSSSNSVKVRTRLLSWLPRANTRRTLLGIQDQRLISRSKATTPDVDLPRTTE